MSLKSSAKSGGGFTPLPAGSHHARCIAVVDLGTQETTYPGKPPKKTPQVRLTWEVPDEPIVINDERAPMTVSQEYTNSLSEKANLRHHLEGWRGKPFSEAELDAFDLSKLIGATCLLSVIHNTSKSGNVYAKVASISKPVKGMAALPEQHHESVIYDVSHGKNEVYEKLPEFIRQKIDACQEWTNPATVGDGAPVNEDDAAPTDAGQDNIPF